MGLLSAGRVGRPHGLDGSFHVTRPRAALLALGGSVRVGGAVREIVRCAGTPDRPILRLDGIDGRPGAESVRGEELLVDRADAPELPAGEYWAEDLEGCAVVTPDGRELGHVQQMRALPSCEVLEVGELLIPMVADAVLEISLAQRRIVVDPAFLGVTAEAGAGTAEAGAGTAVESGQGAEPGPGPRAEPGPEPEAERQAGRDGPGVGPDARRR
jgi:16S rRNA processing protein RimM